ncbi:unnamed protein product [Oppiella nova]|uniref:Uncharacterized protein n=1 Tax=Oppiella nova TaxID=334625 RepID=A0A7R9LJI1_9ACAR|nr:unnamed protein product [Oppiella nova]CAG2163852.1 unnamed protein product [Oppiella nova]
MTCRRSTAPSHCGPFDTKVVMRYVIVCQRMVIATTATAIATHSPRISSPMDSQSIITQAIRDDTKDIQTEGIHDYRPDSQETGQS